MKYTTIFFDLDDTLVDTAQNSKEALLDIFNDRNLNNYYQTFDEFHEKYQHINNNLWILYEQNKITKEFLRTERFLNTLKGALNLTPQESLALNDEFLERVNTRKNVIDGLKETLDYLAPKYKLYILSNGFEEVQYQKMENALIHSYFQEVILSDHVGVNKPNSQIFIHALNIAKVSNKNAIMVGDNIIADVRGAKDSNIDQVWFNPQDKHDEHNIKPTYVIKNLSDLKDIL